MPKPNFTIDMCPPPYGSRGAIYIAVRITRKYQHRIPTRDELMHDWGMSRATAYRWIAAMRDGRGLSSNA